MMLTLPVLPSFCQKTKIPDARVQQHATTVSRIGSPARSISARGPSAGVYFFVSYPPSAAPVHVAYTYVYEARILTARRQLLPCCCCMLRYGHLVFCGVLVIGGGCSACG